MLLPTGPKSEHNSSITSKSRGKNPKFSWLDWNEAEKKGTFITHLQKRKRLEKY